MSKRFILLIIFSIASIGQLCIDIYSPALPHIAKILQTTDTMMKLSISIFLIAFGIGQFIYGILSDTYGRKIPLIIGMVICVIGSIIASFAHNIEMLIIARFLQGAGVAAAASISRPIMSDSFHEVQELAKVTSMMSLVWTFVPIIAPVIGAYIQHFLGWHYIFILLSIYSVLILCLITIKFKETIAVKTPFNYRIVISRIKILLSDKSFISGVTCNMSLYALIISFVTMAPFIIQNELKYSVISFGHIALLAGLSLALGSFLNKRLLNHFSAKIIYNIASYVLFIQAIGFILIGLLTVLNVYALLIPIFLVFITIPMIGPNVLASIMSKFKNIGGTSSALIGLIMFCSAGLITLIESAIRSTSMAQISIVFFSASLITLVTTRAIRHESTKKIN